MKEFEIIFYNKPNGSEPAKDFLLSLDKKMRAKVIMLIELLSVNGPDLREPYSKHISDGIFELRAKIRSDISRILYFFVIGKRIIITNGFIKKTAKTPKSEIELAKKYRNDFLNREARQYDEVQ